VKSSRAVIDQVAAQLILQGLARFSGDAEGNGGRGDMEVSSSSFEEVANALSLLLTGTAPGRSVNFQARSA
jgi:hypothetical protein